MRMFQSVSGNSSEQSTAHFSSRRTVSQFKGVSDTISNWFENHRTQRTQIFTVTTAPFRSKLESNGLQIDNNRKFSEHIFSTPAIFKATSMVFGWLGCSDEKNWLELSSIFFRICRLRSSILFSLQVFIPREATLKSNLTVAWFSWTNHNPLLRIATNEIASFCIDHRWHQMAFFVFVKMGKAPLSRALGEIKQLLCVQSLILYYIKQIDSMLPCICPVIDHRGRQNVVRTSVTHSAIASCATFLFLPHFDVICDLLLDRSTATWNLFVN